MNVLSEMNRATLDPPVTHENIHAFLAEVPVLGKMKMSDDPSLSEVLLSVSQAEYCLSGEVYYTSPMLTSPTAWKNFLYVQSLVILSMDHNFYTHRFSDESFFLLYTLSGKGQLDYEGKTVTLRTGDGVWIDCREEHSYHTVGDTWTHVALHISGQSAAAWYDEYTAAHGISFHQEPGGTFQRNLEQLIRDYETLSFGRDVRITNVLSNLLTALIINSGTETSSRDGILTVLEQVLIYLEQHMHETITLDDLSSISHISKYHLAHEFQRATGYSPIEYLIQLRLQKACFLLRTTSLPVHQIAAQAGIPNSHYFGKLFKKKLGQTPGEYRRSQAG